MKLHWKLVVASGVLFALAQLIRPVIPSNPAKAEVLVPPAIKQILEKDCYSCHSDERRLSWFDQIEPGYWFVRKDILDARAHLNFSTLGAAPAAVQRARLFEAVNMIQLGAMPLPQFVALHPDAKVTPQEMAELMTYLAPWESPPLRAISTTKNDAPPVSAQGTEASPRSLSSVPQEHNGLQFDPSFESWKLLSTTDRGDNNTLRFILGNDIAIRAAESGNISPWPDGSRFAKVAWQQELGADKLIHPGKFVQVELMVKDARLYKDTDGWGWGRWRGLDLKPYGENARFVDECTGCHMPVRANDYVYTLPITRAPSNRDELVNNAAASLPWNLPWQPLGWQAITMYVDPRTHTMATLFGKDTGIQPVAPRSAADTDSSSYPAGAVLALVTWAQRDDPHWFGGRIPNAPLSVEFVHISPERKADGYRVFSRDGLVEQHVNSNTAADRTNLILNLPSARLP